ncbi:unnamed protein product [Mytilus coruscus]|uniref:Uncharacterized protein n=1 Tax=Mytilus coruscus TaxID=42192 RepID=A0A6J8EQ31_MYTCO|nr:unnamed protein product [Mytilus coruscus]
MSRSRAVRKLKRALPVTPSKRVATVKAYLSTNKSPTAITLQRIGLVPSPEEIKELKLNASLVEDIKTFLSNEKLKRNDQSRATVEVLAASVSGPAVGNCRAKADLAKKLGVPIDVLLKDFVYGQGFLLQKSLLTSMSKEKRGWINCLKNSHRKQLIKDNVIDEKKIELFGTLTELCAATLRPITEGTLHLKECLERNSSACGVHLLKFSESELCISDDCTNLQWKKSNGGTLENRIHSFRAKWQTDQLKKLVENLPENECVTVHDFSENYRCTERVEIQSSYFQRTEVSIHVTLIYRHAVLEIDGASSTPDDPTIICEHFYFISPDEKHDQYFTRHVQNLVSEYLNEINYRVDTMHEFCDGCQSQYKSRHCIGTLAESAAEFGYKK